MEPQLPTVEAAVVHKSPNHVFEILYETATSDTICDETGHRTTGHLVNFSVFGNLRMVARRLDVVRVTANRK